MSEYNLEPDLFTLGKIIGGGMPVGLVCAAKDNVSCRPYHERSAYMRCSIGGGTFSANPATMSAGLSTLNYLKSNKQTIYTKLNSLGEQLRKRLTCLFNDSKINVKVTGMGSFFMPHFLGRRDNNKGQSR